MSSYEDARDFTVNLDVESRQRRFRVHRRDTDSSGAPLIVALHGTGINSEHMAEFCGLNALADREGFVVAYPDGTGRTDTALTWNIGHQASYATRQCVNDVEFFVRLIDWCVLRLGVDSQRIYLTGISSGAMLCYLLATKLSSKVAAIGPVAGTLMNDHWQPVAVPVMHIHGTTDNFVPYDGGRGPRSLTKIEFPSVRRTIEWWAAANQCVQTDIRHCSPTVQDGTRIVRESYARETDQERVVLFTVQNGGHTWPGQPWNHPAAAQLGVTTQNLDAGKALWDFFKAFRSPVYR